jgi:hypothetical protein
MPGLGRILCYLQYSEYIQSLTGTFTYTRPLLKLGAACFSIFPNAPAAMTNYAMLSRLREAISLLVFPVSRSAKTRCLQRHAEGRYQGRECLGHFGSLDVHIQGP